MNELAFRHHFPILRLWEIFQTLKGTQLCREWSDLAEIRTCPRFYACSRYLKIWKKSDKKQQRKGGDIAFPIISQLALSVSMETSFDPICPKTLCNLSPTLMMLHTKFDQYWPTGLRDIQVSSELWQNHRISEGQGKSSIAQLFQSVAIMTEPQNSGRTRQIQYSSYFFKAGL